MTGFWILQLGNLAFSYITLEQVIIVYVSERNRLIVSFCVSKIFGLFYISKNKMKFKFLVLISK